MIVSKKKFMKLLAALNLLFIVGLMFLLNGCTTNSQGLIKNAKREIAIRNLLHQKELEKKHLLVSNEIKVSDIMEKELEAQKPDPSHPVGRSYISTFSKAAIDFNPSLSLRKYSTTLLSSKTGQKATYTTTFNILNLNLANFLSTKFYIKIKYLDKIIEEEAHKKGYKAGYILSIRKRMNGYGSWGSFVANMRTNPYFISLEEITYRAIALYQLSSESAKISVMVYYLQQNEFNKIDKILTKKWKQEAQKKADAINANRYKNTKDSVLTYRNISIDDMKRVSSIHSKLYYKLLPSELVEVRKKEVEKTLKKFFTILENENISNALEVIQRYSKDKDILNALNVALWNSGNKNPLLIDYSIYSKTCLEAGIYGLYNYFSIEMYGYRYLLDNLAYNVSVMENLKCPETSIFKKKLKKAIERVER